MPEPRCPYCSTSGEELIATQNFATFTLIYCGQCGAIHGVLPLLPAVADPPPAKKKVSAPSDSAGREPAYSEARPKSEASSAGGPKTVYTVPTPPMPPQHAALTETELVQIVADFTGERGVSLTLGQMEHMYRNATSIDDATAPLCPDHRIRMVRLTIPDDFDLGGQMLWACPRYRQCRQRQAIVPNDGKPKRRRHTPLDELGNADLSQKTPYSIEQMVARMRAAGINQGTRYLHIAMDDGPPLCPHHKTEMQEITIPDGYPNTGHRMWVCPGYKECRAWELIE